MIDKTWMISLDIGGTTATGVALRWPDDSAMRLTCPSKNLRLMSPAEMAELARNISLQIDSNGGSANHAVWLIDAAGARPETDRNRWNDALASIGLTPAEIVVSRDYEANHAAAFAGEEGILSVNGTGSVLFGRRAGRDRRRGGWGFLLDTTPSGAEFGRLALQQVLGAIEGDITGKSILANFKKQFSHLHLDRAALLDWLYADPAAQRRLGEIAPVLTIAADEGDLTAEVLVSTSLRRWAADVRTLAGDLGFGNSITLAGVGGLWNHWQKFPARALAALDEREPGRFKMKEPAFPPFWGPLLRYFSSSASGIETDILIQLRKLAERLP